MFEESLSLLNSSNKSQRDELEDLQLLNKVKDDDRKAFVRLFSKYYEFLCRVIFRYLENQEDAEEIASDIFQKLWEKREQLQVRSNFRAYLKYAGRNKALNFLRDRKLEQVPLDIARHDVIIVDDQLDIANLEFELIKHLKTVPDKRKQILLLNKIYGYKPVEIAQLMNLSEKTVINQISLGLKHLKESAGEKKRSSLI